MKARKRFGQHFLEPAWVDRVVEAVRPSPDDVFLEIGAGRGVLTLALARRVRQVVAVEIDRDLAPALSSRAPKNVRVVAADFLKTDAAALLPQGAPFRVAGNLPYNISTPILFRLLALADDGCRITDATVMLQREVAARLTARPGTGDWGVLTACQRLRADVELVVELPPGAFRPAPKVRSAVVRLAYRRPRPAVASARVFEAMVRAIFMQRRKMLANALADFASRHGMEASAVLTKASLDGRRRPETLDVAELARLADLFTSA